MTNPAQVVDQAMATAVTTVMRAAIDRGIDGADIRTTLAQMDGSGMRDVLTYSFINRSWMAGEDQERHSIMATLDRIGKAARMRKDGDLLTAAEATKELLDKYKPATYDDVRAGLEAADKLLEALNYDEPSIPRSEQDEAGSTDPVSTQGESADSSDVIRPGRLGRGDDRGRGINLSSEKQVGEYPVGGVQHRRRDHLDPAPVRGGGDRTVSCSSAGQPPVERGGVAREQGILDLATQPAGTGSHSGASDHSLDDHQGQFAADARITHALLKKAQDTPYSKGWWNTAALAMEKALVLLEDDTLRAALPEDSHLQLDAGLEELRLLYASLELDPRVNKDTVHNEYAGESELQVVNNTAPETLAHVDEADVLLEAQVNKVGQPEPEENVIPSGQTSINSPPPHLTGDEIQGEVSREVVKADRWGRKIGKANGLDLVAIACVVNDQGFVLLGRKPEDEDSDMAGQVVLPGGHVEEGETPEAACAREVAEETGASIIVGKELLVQAKNGNELHFFLATMSPDGIPLPGGAQPENNPYDTAELTEVGFQDPAEADLDDLNRRVVEMAHPSAVSLATDMSSIMQGEDVEKAQQATGQNIADALWSGFGKAMEAWGGDPWLPEGSRLTKGVRFGELITSRLHTTYNDVSDRALVREVLPDTEKRIAVAGAIGEGLDAFSKELKRIGVYDLECPESFVNEVLSLSQSWGGTDQTSGMWDHKGGGDILTTDDSSGGKDTAHLKDTHPNGVEGRGLEQSVSRKAAPEDPDEDPKPRLYKGYSETDDKETNPGTAPSDDRGPGRLGRGDDRGRGVRSPVSGRQESLDADSRSHLGSEHRRRDHLDPAPVRGGGDSDLLPAKTRRVGQEELLEMETESSTPGPHSRTADRAVDVSQRGQTVREPSRSGVLQKTTGVGESHQHFAGDEGFQDGPGPADVEEIPVDQGVTTDIVKSTMAPDNVYPIQDGIADGAKGGVMPGHGPMKQVGNDTDASAGIMKAPGEDGMTQPTHLKGGTPAVTIDEDAHSATRMPDARAVDRDQRGADINPLNLADEDSFFNPLRLTMGDEDVRALGKLWRALAKQTISDPGVRLAFIRNQDGTDREINLD